ncbi:MAG TPA: hypothetical protein VIK86_05140 [Candidatus Paceibacterota bacterium]
MGTLLDLNPRPQGGEWYSVLCCGMSVRIAVFIDKDLPLLAMLSDQLYTPIVQCKDPILLSAEEAEKHLIQEIEDLELISAYSKGSFEAICARRIHAFKIKFFG